MRFGNQVLKQLDKRLTASNKERSSRKKTASFTVQGIKMTFRIVDSDKFSYALKRLALEPAKTGDPLPVQDLRQRAEAFADAATYLPEKLGVIEADRLSGVQMRSIASTRSDKRLTYFEMILTPEARVSLVRKIHDSKTGLTDETAFQMTAETLARLLDDLSRVCQSTQP